MAWSAKGNPNVVDLPSIEGSNPNHRVEFHAYVHRSAGCDIGPLMTSALRAYGVAAGDVVPSIHDVHGRKGIFLPPRLYAGFNYFEGVRIEEKKAGWAGYGPVFRAYFGRVPAASEVGAQPTFVPYAGSEGYSPVAYLPQVAAAITARALDLEFLTTFYLMRFAGLAVTTIVIAFAISRALLLEPWAVQAKGCKSQSEHKISACPA
jgi:hypothetical protein